MEKIEINGESYIKQSSIEQANYVPSSIKNFSKY